MDKNVSDDFDIMFGYNSGNIIIKKRIKEKVYKDILNFYEGKKC